MITGVRYIYIYADSTVYRRCVGMDLAVGIDCMLQHSKYYMYVAGFSVIIMYMIPWACAWVWPKASYVPYLLC